MGISRQPPIVGLLFTVASGLVFDRRQHPSLPRVLAGRTQRGTHHGVVLCAPWHAVEAGADGTLRTRGRDGASGPRLFVVSRKLPVYPPCRVRHHGDEYDELKQPDEPRVGPAEYSAACLEPDPSDDD